MYHLGVDTGGTFTDFVALDAASGRFLTFKVPSVPDDPGRAVADGLDRLASRHGIGAADIARFVFGTTVATNAILESKGAKTALVTTRGARDVIEIQRLWRHRLFDLYIRKPAPLVPRRARYEVAERIGAQGEVVQPLDDREAARIAEVVAAGGYESVAVCLLFAFLDPRHEERLRAAIAAAAPGLHLSLSSEISPQFREYERTSTTVMNAYVMPRIHGLVDRLTSLLADAGYGGVLRVMQSNGGLMNAEKTRTHPAHTLLSGPAGGVVGALRVAATAGVEDVITMDMGGTSLDICLVRGGAVTLSSEGRVGGYPVQVPQVNVHTIGAGGGSIARVVRGALKVGPESAGAVPGPVCYGHGGTEPTSTDAAVVLGFIDPDYFAGGEITLDAAAARAAIRAGVAAPLGLDEAAGAMAVVRVQVANMVTGIRAVSVEKGLDPRAFTLLPFGGAGSLYAPLVAAELGIRRIFVPVHPSVLSALGMLVSDVKYTEVVTRLMAADEAGAAEIERVFRAIEDRLLTGLAEEGMAAGEVELARSCDMRYRGQAYEINIAVPVGALEGGAAALIERFHDQHQALYGQSAPGEAVELVNFRVTGTGPVPKAEFRALERAPASAPSEKGSRDAYFGDPVGWQATPVYERAELAPGATFAGPALVEEAGATIVVYPGDRLSVDGYGNLTIELA